jgi:hypothetical protein
MISKGVNFVNDYQKDYEYVINILKKKNWNIKNLLTTFKKLSCFKICEIKKIQRTSKLT